MLKAVLVEAVEAQMQKMVELDFFKLEPGTPDSASIQKYKKARHQLEGAASYLGIPIPGSDSETATNLDSSDDRDLEPEPEPEPETNCELMDIDKSQRGLEASATATSELGKSHGLQALASGNRGASSSNGPGGPTTNKAEASPLGVPNVPKIATTASPAATSRSPTNTQLSPKPDAGTQPEQPGNIDNIDEVVNFGPVDGASQPSPIPSSQQDKKSPMFSRANDSESEEELEEVSEKKLVCLNLVIHGGGHLSRARTHAQRFAVHLSASPDAKIDLDKDKDLPPAFRKTVSSYTSSNDMLAPGESVDDQEPLWILVQVAVQNGLPGVVLPHTMVDSGLNDREILERAKMLLLQYGLSTHIPPNDEFENVMHGSLHRQIFSGGEEHADVIHIGVSLSANMLNALADNCPYVDKDGMTWQLAWAPYVKIGSEHRESYGINTKHLWCLFSETGFIDDALGNNLKHMRYQARNHTVASHLKDGAPSTVHAASLTKDISDVQITNVKWEDFMKWAEKHRISLGPGGMFKGEPDENRILWMKSELELLCGPMPNGMSSTHLQELFAGSLSTSKPKGHKESPRDYFRTHLTRVAQHAITTGADVNLTMNSTMSEEERSVKAEEWITLMNERYPLVDAVGSAIKLFKDYTPQSPSHFKEWMTHLIHGLKAVYTAESQDPAYTRGCGFWERERAQPSLHDMMKLFAKHLDAHVKIINSANRPANYGTSSIFTELWRRLSQVNGSNGVFMCVVEQAWQDVDELSYVDVDGKTVIEQKNPAFAWNATPIRWTIQALLDFWYGDCYDLRGRTVCTLMEHLHVSRVFIKGVPLLSPGSDPAASKKTGQSKKAAVPVAGAEGKERISVNNIQDFNSVYHDFIAEASQAKLNKNERKWRRARVRTGKWPVGCKQMAQDKIVAAEPSDHCNYCNGNHSTFDCKKTDQIKKAQKMAEDEFQEQQAKWKAKDELDKTGQAAVGAVDGDDEGGSVGSKKKKKKKTKKGSNADNAEPLEVCSVDISKLQSNGRVKDGITTEKVESEGFEDYSVGEIPTELCGVGTQYKSGMSSGTTPSQGAVKQVSKDRGVSLVWDPKAKLDLDEPGYTGGHFRINKKSFP